MEQQIKSHIDTLAKRLTREIKAQDVQIVMSWSDELLIAISKELDKKFNNPACVQLTKNFKLSLLK